MKAFFFLAREIGQGKSLLRSTLDWELKKEFLTGRILDLGSGSADYYSKFIPREKESSYELLDIKKGATVDFETDTLPYADNTFDAVLFLNVLEHIFNYTHILEEIRRIKKDDGIVLGYVPFLMWYHPDYCDYFRYTHESLEKILNGAGYSEVSITKIYRGPYTSAFHMIYSTIPRVVRPFVFAVAYSIDSLFRKLRSKNAERYVLGYVFKAK